MTKKLDLAKSQPVKLGNYLLTSPNEAKQLKGFQDKMTLAIKKSEEDQDQPLRFPFDLQGLKALVVDDNPVSLKLMEKMLGSFKFEVETAKTPVRFLGSVERKRRKCMVASM